MINPPKWCSKAIPTVRGWKHHARREILKPQRFTQEQCDEYMIANGLMEAPKVITEVPKVEAPAMLNEAPVGGDLDGMTKIQLEKQARKEGLELDRREKKESLVEHCLNSL